MFEDCENLRTIWVEDGCRAEISNMYVSGSVKIGPLVETMAENMRVWDLRVLTDVVLPNGITFVGSHWFYECEIKSVEIPASVVEIGVEAFCGCDKLEKIMFNGAAVTKNESRTGSQKCLSRPEGRSQLMVIDTGAFRWCGGLKDIQFPEELIQIGRNAFRSSGLESVIIPASVRIIHQGAFAECEDLAEAVLNEGLEILGTEERTGEGELQSGVF